MTDYIGKCPHGYPKCKICGHTTVETAAMQKHLQTQHNKPSRNQQSLTEVEQE